MINKPVQASLDPTRASEGPDGTEVAQRLAEQLNGFWNDHESDIRNPVNTLTRAQAIAQGYTVSKRYA